MKDLIRVRTNLIGTREARELEQALCDVWPDWMAEKIARAIIRVAEASSERPPSPPPAEK